MKMHLAADFKLCEGHLKVDLNWKTGILPTYWFQVAQAKHEFAELEI